MNSVINDNFSPLKKRNYRNFIFAGKLLSTNVNCLLQVLTLVKVEETRTQLYETNIFKIYFIQIFNSFLQTYCSIVVYKKNHLYFFFFKCASFMLKLRFHVCLQKSLYILAIIKSQTRDDTTTSPPIFLQNLDNKAGRWNKLINFARSDRHWSLIESSINFYKGQLLISIVCFCSFQYLYVFYVNQRSLTTHFKHVNTQRCYEFET